MIPASAGMTARFLLSPVLVVLSFRMSTLPTTLLVSGVKPTSLPHLGNYIGALKQWVTLSEQHPCYFFIADLHAITVPQDPKELKQRILETLAVYLAIGIDPKKATFFVQSEVSAHGEMQWLLNTISKLGELERMTQFKDKSQKESRESCGMGLLTYPILMAGDILLYKATDVPVGDDQEQHVEMTRILARRFNDRFGKTFVPPTSLVQTAGGRIMSLAHPEKKMSKSDESQVGTISLIDDADTIRKKIMKAVTDTEPDVVFDPEKKPAVANLMTIFHHMSGKTMEEIEAQFAGKGYGDFKTALADATIAHLAPITAKIHELLAHPEELHHILDEGRERASHIANKTLNEVKEKMGLNRR
jgi:tryptophanyl-tRNA synthetase